ncbi:MAG: hypothetical protein GW938_00755 [Leptospira sp.]|nr:hypothetical protein [Leptospira sp.]NCS93516.1 hypothetical protein [Leptospira sp.]
MKLDPKGIDPSKALGALDSLANKIPDDIAKLLKKIAIALFAFFLMVAAYYGWTIGYGDTQAEGLKLAEDTKSMFYEDLERDYNRKRKNINLSDVDLDISRKVDEQMIRDSLRYNQSPESKILDSNKEPLTDSADLNSQRKDFGVPPLMTVPDSPTREWIPGRDESEESNSPVIERIEKQIQETESATSRLEKTLDRLEAVEKKVNNNSKLQNNTDFQNNLSPQNSNSTDQQNDLKKERRELISAPKSR